MRKAIISFALLCTCLALSTGCAAWTDKSKKKDSMWSSMQFWKKPYQKPDKLAAIWTHDILTMSGKPPTRGFGGRLYFYNPKSQAIPVEGELTVHGYEESRVGLRIINEKTQADKTFMFTAEQFTEHFSPSDLGASYSVWIPWDAADGMQKEITLIPTFKDKEGVILQGEPAKLVLPGRKPEDPLAAAAFQAVSFQQSQIPTNSGPLQQLNAPPQTGLRTTTISVPSSSRLGRDGSTASNTSYNTNSSVQVTESNPMATSGNMIYAGSPQANRVQAMYAALANQQAGGQQPSNLTPAGSMPNMSMPNMNGAMSTMPNMQPAQASALPANQQYQLQNPNMPSAQFNGMNFGASQQRTTSNGASNPTSGSANPASGTSMPTMSAPSGQGQTPNNSQPQWMNQQPGFAMPYTPVQPGAVEAAFAANPQLRSISQLQQAQWQAFGQSGAPTTGTQPANVQPASAQTVNGQPVTGQPVTGQPGQPGTQVVQPAMFNQQMNQPFNQVQPAINQAQAPGQFQR